VIAATLSEAASWVNGTLQGRDAKFSGVSTDTRRLVPGQLFAALRGPNFDAHEFLPQAAANGAVAALVERDLAAPLALLRITDSRLALGRLAAAWRQRFDIPVVAVTGSNGKTTVKEMLASILSHSGPLLVTRGNLNNDIGLPLTLFELSGSHRAAVLELGANHPTEIGYLGGLAKPSVAVINNAGPAHLEGFGTVEGVAHAKGELIGALGPSGIAVFNGDDEYVDVWRALCGDRRCFEFGFEAGCQIRGEMRAGGFDLLLGDERRTVRMPVPGRHNVMNALAAAAGAWAAGAAPDAIVAGLENAPSVPGRMQSLAGLHDSRLVDDTYNANPLSLDAALQTVSADRGQKWLVLGDMKELGADAAQLHRTAGERARALGFTRLYSLGSLAAEASRGFGGGGFEFEAAEALCEALRQALESADPGLTLLIKGSRGMRMERVVEALSRPGERA